VTILSNALLIHWIFTGLDLASFNYELLLIFIFMYVFLSQAVRIFQKGFIQKLIKFCSLILQVEFLNCFLKGKAEVSFLQKMLHAKDSNFYIIIQISSNKNNIIALSYTTLNKITIYRILKL